MVLILLDAIIGSVCTLRADNSVNEANLADGEAKHFLEVCRLADKEQVEGPAAAEVCHNDSIDRHGGKETTPWGLEFLLKVKRVSRFKT